MSSGVPNLDVGCTFFNRFFVAERRVNERRSICSRVNEWTGRVAHCCFETIRTMATRVFALQNRPVPRATLPIPHTIYASSSFTFPAVKVVSSPLGKFEQLPDSLLGIIGAYIERPREMAEFIRLFPENKKAEVFGAILADNHCIYDAIFLGMQARMLSIFSRDVEPRYDAGSINAMQSFEDLNVFDSQYEAEQRSSGLNYLMRMIDQYANIPPDLMSLFDTQPVQSVVRGCGGRLNVCVTNEWVLPKICEEHPRLEALNVYMTPPVTGWSVVPNLRCLSTLQHVRKLALAGDCKNLSLEFLQELPNLETCQIMHLTSPMRIDASDSWISYVQHCNALKRLSVCGHVVKNLGLLALLPDLETINFTGCCISLGEIQQLQQLKNISFIMCWKASPGAELRDHRMMDTVSVREFITDLDVLHRLPNLQTLRVSANGVCPDLQAQLEERFPHLQISTRHWHWH